MLTLQQVMLAGESLDPGLKLEAVADRTDGYSGSDLRHLCSAAAMRPLRELLTASGKSSFQKVRGRLVSQLRAVAIGACASYAYSHDPSSPL